MGLFNLFSKKSIKPYKSDSLNFVYDLLFCDQLDLYKSQNKSREYPWNILLAEKPDLQELKEVANNKTLESRQRLLAYRILAANGEKTAQKELLGVIIEVAMPNGLDVLAAFSDRTARYINHSEKLLVWETRTEQSDQLIDKLFSDSVDVVNQIGPWNEERRSFPVKNVVRLSFLVSDGLYFGEGPFEILQVDPLGRSVIYSATQLMLFLTQQKFTAGETNP